MHNLNTEPKKRGRPRKDATDPMPKKTLPVPQETVPGPKETPAITAGAPRRRVGNPALTGEALDVSPSDNAKYITQGMQLIHLPNIDLHDPDAVCKRIDEYLNIFLSNGNKPTVAGLALALNGMRRQALYEICSGNYRFGKVPYDLPTEVSDVIKKTYFMLEEMWEEYMMNGKINPVSGIFLGKNHFNYQDKTEYVLTPNAQGSDFSEKQLLDRYNIDSELSDSDSADSD